MGDRTDCWRIVVLLCLNIGIVTSFRYEIPTDRLRNTEPSFSFVTSSSNNDRSEFSSFSGPKHTSFEDSEPWDSNSAVASPANSQEPVVPVQSESRVFQDRQLFPPEEHAYRWNSQDRQPQSYANGNPIVIECIFVHIFKFSEITLTVLQIGAANDREVMKSQD